MSALNYDVKSFQKLSMLGIGCGMRPLEKLPENLGVLVKVGFEYVYFNELFHFVRTETAGAKALQFIKKAVADSGLKINSSHFGLMFPGPKETLQEVKDRHLFDLDVAAEMNLQYVTTHYISMGGTDDPEFVKPETFSAYLLNPIKGGPAVFEEAMAGLGGKEVFLQNNNEMYRWFCDEAAKRNITVTLETATCHLSRTPAQIIEIIKQIGRPNLGICLDSGHTHIAGVDVAEAVRQAGKYLLETHFHDNVADLDLHRPIGIGTINWPEVILALREIGFPGPITFEANGAPHCTPEDECRLYAQNWREFLYTTAYREARYKAFAGSQ